MSYPTYRKKKKTIEKETVWIQYAMKYFIFNEFLFKLNIL